MGGLYILVPTLLTISATGLPEKGFRILGIERDGDWIAAPKSAQDLQEGDRIVVYGRLTELRTLAAEN